MLLSDGLANEGDTTHEGLMARADEMAEEESETREHLEAVREAADSASAEAEQDETVLVEVPDEE